MKTRMPAGRMAIGAGLLSLGLVVACPGKEVRRVPGSVVDEAREAGRSPESFPAADEDYFREMDGGIPLEAREVKGRNTWMVWTGGNDRFWDTISNESFGSLDLLKTVSSHPGLKFGRHNRWKYLGLVNEPCFDAPSAPDPARFGLWLDNRRGDCPADPFESEARYPGVAVRARGKSLPAGSYYGLASGVVGLRLFPNPAFDEDAALRWDPKRYYEDPSYYLSESLVRPYRVGMSCAFCHVGPNPVNPPADPEHPEWKHLSTNVGAQYFWIDRIFFWDADETNFVYQLFHTSRPGALDTSLVSTDGINNPRTMNAIYNLGSRLDAAKRWGREQLGGGALQSRQFNDFVNEGVLTEFYRKPDTVWTPRVLKDGSDSIGALGALNRVYLNIGLFSEEWLLHFNPLVGGKRSSPIEIGVARKNSAYWQATESQTVDMALFFLKSAGPHRLSDAPGGEQHITRDAEILKRGKLAFADNCARCHSSKLPASAEAFGLDGCAGPGYLQCWNRYWDFTNTEPFREEMREIVLADDFLEDNFLSTDLRVPVSLLGTNACSPLASNALEGEIWDNFSSASYKSLPSVGEITVHNPMTGRPWSYKMPAGGRGYTRPASLVSVWSTAPFLLNNTVGRFEWDPSVESRMKSFDDSIEKLLWPEKRERDLLLGDKVPGMIDRTTTASYIRIAPGYLPGDLAGLQSPLERLLPWVFGSGGVEIGPIPKGVPVNLLANLKILAETREPLDRVKHAEKLIALLLRLKKDLKALPPNASDDQARAVFANLVDPLIELSTCPDFVVNRGHYFGTGLAGAHVGLPDEDKRALIEFLKTF